MKIPENTIEQIIDHYPVARLATLDAVSNIHQVPIVFVRCNGRLWSPIDGKPKSAGEPVRVANIRRHPAVSLLIDAYQPDWSGLWWVRIAGTAEIVEADSAIGPHVESVVQSLQDKYPQYGDTAVLREPRTLVAIGVNRQTGWCAGDPGDIPLNGPGA